MNVGKLKSLKLIGSCICCCKVQLQMLRICTCTTKTFQQNLNIQMHFQYHFLKHYYKYPERLKKDNMKLHCTIGQFTFPCAGLYKIFHDLSGRCSLNISMWLTPAVTDSHTDCPLPLDVCCPLFIALQTYLHREVYVPWPYLSLWTQGTTLWRLK